MEDVLKNWLCSLGKDILDDFSKQSTDFERAYFLGNLFRATPPELFAKPVGKHAQLASEFRELGNKHYKDKLLDSAIHFYTKSISYAPVNSKEYALALGNRSACSLVMKNPACALTDINRALTIAGLDFAFKEKLTNRRKECEKNVLAISNPPVRLPVLSTHNRFFTCATNKVEIAENKKVGRHLVINRHSKAGEVLMIEEPFASVLIPACFYSNCYNCFKYCQCLLPCEKCTTSVFCSVTCLEESKELHEIECNVVQRLASLNFGKLEFLALRILLVASNGGKSLNTVKNMLDKRENIEIYNSMDFFRVYDLVGNTEKRSNMDLLQRTFTACTIVSALGSFSKIFHQCPGLETFAAGVLLRFLQNLPCNAHEITEFRNGMITEVAGGAYATFSLLNHSCDPNVVRQSCGNRVILRAIQDIKAGDELVDNYGYHHATHNLQERQAGLKQYYFTCQCLACRENWQLYHDLPSDEPVFKTNDPEVRYLYYKLTAEFEEKLQLVIENKITVEAMDFLCKYLSFLDETVKRPWQDYNKCQEAIKHGFDYFPDYNRKS